DVELAEDAGVLGEVAHAEAGAAVHGQGGDVPADEGDLALVGGDLSGGHAEAGGLAGAGGAEQADDLADVHVAIDAIDDLASAVDLHQPAHFQDGHAVLPDPLLEMVSTGCYTAKGGEGARRGQRAGRAGRTTSASRDWIVPFQ